MSHPDDKKYRRIPLINEAYKSRVKTVGGDKFLVASGFELKPPFTHWEWNTDTLSDTEKEQRLTLLQGAQHLLQQFRDNPSKQFLAAEFNTQASQENSATPTPVPASIADNATNTANTAATATHSGTTVPHSLPVTASSAPLAANTDANSEVNGDSSTSTSRSASVSPAPADASASDPVDSSISVAAAVDAASFTA